VTGIIIKAAGAAVYWSSKKQSNVANSSTEAEYIAAAEAAMSVYAFRVFMEEIGQPQREPTPLLMDNQSAILCMEAEKATARRKHINVKYHYVREQFHAGNIKASWIQTADQQADICTKPLPRPAFIRLQAAVLGLPTPSSDG
jgi:hypothetical protein